MKEFKNDNSKKLIIGVSILFCAVILIIGGTLAYFTQSGMANTGNIVTTDIDGSLLIDDNPNYMFGNFIPVEENDVLSFASLTDKCKYQEGMYACNLYEFTITNNSNVSQELIFTLDVQENGFSNLYYNLVESSINDINTNTNYINSKVPINGTGEKEILNGIVLGPKLSKTYTIIYYVKNINSDQTSVDSGKKIYANVRVDSITTGMYAEPIMEAKDCYEYELIEDNDTNREQYGELFNEVVGTYKLTKFNGIETDGTPKTQCRVSKEGLYYSVIVPSKIKDEEGNELEVSTIGNNLFFGLDFSSGNLTNNSKIEHISINEGIKVIEDGSSSTGGAFSAIGIDNNLNLVENFQFTIDFPNTLIHLGAYSFMANQIYNLNIPSNVKIIGEYLTGADKMESVLSTLTFEENSSLTTIGEEAFSYCKIESLTIPSSVVTIKKNAFRYNYNLSKITFEGATTNQSSLTTIGEYAFRNASLNYTNESLILPASITEIGDDAFTAKADKITNFQNILFMGNRTQLNNLGTGWYNSEYTNVTPYKEN